MKKLPAVFDSAESLSGAIDAYFAAVAGSVADRDLKTGGVQPWQTDVPSMVGLAVHLGVPKQTLYRLIDEGNNTSIDIDTDTGNNGNSNRQYIYDSLSRARDRLETGALRAAASGRIDSRTAALILAGYGYGQRLDVSGEARVTVAGAGAADVAQWSE